MGYLPPPTPEMGEYHVEIRRESFYLRRADGIIAYVTLSHDEKKIGEALAMARRLVKAEAEHDLPAICGVLEEEFTRAVKRVTSYDHMHASCELLTGDIPKIRAALDQVELERG